MAKINERRLQQFRMQPRFKKLEDQSDSESDGPELFTANPSDDIPNNKLTEQLARGLQAYVQRMQKKESFYVEISPVEVRKWCPAPREFSSLTFCNRRCYLFGGLNYDTNNEVAQFRFQEALQWVNIKYSSNDKIMGRCRHSACAYGDKIVIFGGCFMFNRKRQLRECTAQVLIYDTIDEQLDVLKTKGITVQQRKDHMAAIVGSSMLVFGG